MLEWLVPSRALASLLACPVAPGFCTLEETHLASIPSPPWSTHGEPQILSVTVVFGCHFQAAAWGATISRTPHGRELQELDIILWNQPSLAVQGPFQPSGFP